MEEKIKGFLKNRFLIEFVGDVTPQTDLFKECGLDSSGYMEILAFIQDEFKIVVTDDELFSNVLATLASITSFVNAKLGPCNMPEHAPNRWIAGRQPNPRATLRLFCFPYAGAGAPAFRRLERALPSSIDVLAIELPGRWSRIREPFITSMPALIEAIDNGLSEYLDTPFALLGYSFGSLVAFEYARRLRRCRRLVPNRLVLSAFGHPTRSRNPRFHTLPDDEFVRALGERYGWSDESVLADQAMRDLVLPIVRADMRIMATYEYMKEDPLSCPINVFGGEWDQAATQEALAEWRRETTASFHLTMFPGAAHFFMHQRAEDYAAAIAATLLDTLSTNKQIVDAQGMR